MDDHSPLTPKRSTAHADIRNYFHPSPNQIPPALTTPSHPVPHVRARSDAAHNAMFEEWKAPVYKPRTPRSKSDGNSIRNPPQSPQYGLTRGQTVDLHQSPIISGRCQSGSSSAQRRAQTEGHTKIPQVSRCSPTSDGETLSQIPLILLGNTAVMDRSLVPKPLKLTSPHSAFQSAPRTETSDFFMESRTSTHEKQCLDIDPSSTGLLSDGSDVLNGTRRITTKPINLKPEFGPSRLTWDDEAAMYLLPSPTLTYSVPSVPEKARRILGTDGDRGNIPKIQPATQPECDIYTGPTWANECQTSRHRVETAEEVRVAKEKSIAGTTSKKKKKGGRFAKFIFGGAVDDTVI